MKNKMLVILVALALVCSAAGCATFSGGAVEDRLGNPGAALAAATQAPTTQPTLKPTAKPTVKATKIPAKPTPTPTLVPGLETGPHPYTNANVARDVAVYNGVIYAATLGGMVAWRLDSGYAMRYTPLDGMTHVSAYSVTFCKIPEPRILVGTLSGISIYDPATGLWEQRELAPAESRLSTSKIMRLYCDQANNRLLIGYNGLGVLDLKTGAFQRFTSSDGLLWEAVSDIAVQKKDIWIANGYKGIAKISNGKVTTYTTANGLPDDSAYALAVAKDGSLWVGGSKGLSNFKGDKWTLYGADSPAKLNSVNEIEVDAAGKLWAATAPWGAGRLCQFNPATAACDVDYRDAEGGAMLGLALTADAAPVYATDLGVYVFKKGAAQAFKTPDALASNFVDSFATAPDGSLWLGTDTGLQVLDPLNPLGKWKTFTQKIDPALGGNWATALAFAPDGTLWAAMLNGSASRYQNGVWTAFKEVSSFNSVTVDAKGRAWFGDDGKGILVLNPDGTQALKLTIAEGLPSDTVQALLADSKGRVWIATDKGLAKYEKDALQVVFAKGDPLLPDTYLRSLSLDENGALLIGGSMWLARYDGKQVKLLLDFAQAGFSDARLTNVAVAPRSGLFVGTDKGLLFSEDGLKWVRITTADGLLTNYISALHVDAAGALWVGGGGSNFDGGGLLHIVP